MNKEECFITEVEHTQLNLPQNAEVDDRVLSGISFFTH